MSSTVPQILSVYKIELQGDPDIPDYALRTMRGGTEVEISGGIKYGLADDFLKILKHSPQIEVVHLNSVGGRVGEAVKLSKIIREAGLKTYVSNVCASGCTVAFAGGVERWVLPSAVMGFHGIAFPGLSAAQLRDSNREQVAIMIASGYDKAFVEKAAAVPGDELWKPTITELKNANVVTAVSDGTQFALSGFGKDGPEGLLSGAIADRVPILKQLKIRYPDEFGLLVEEYMDAYADGETQEYGNDVLRYHIYSSVTDHAQSATDEAIVALGKLLVEELEVLKERDVEDCATFGASAGADIDIQYSFSNKIMMKYQSVGARVIETSTERSPDDEVAVAASLKGIIDQMRGTFTEKQISLLDAGEPSPEQASDYCVAAIGLYQHILKAPQAEAAAMLRSRMKVD